jgi:hypothetical protein
MNNGSMMRALVISMITLSLLSCSNRNADIALLPNTNGQTQIDLTDNEMIIIDSLIKEAVNGRNRKVKSYFKEWKLKDPKMSSQLNDFIIDLKNYKRQYLVSLNQKGKKVVHVNCLCSVFGMDDWKTQEIVVRDGGKCFFQLDVNLFEKTYIDFIVNGSA